MTVAETVINPSASVRNAREETKVVRSILPRPIFCLDHRFVRQNCAQRTATVTLRERPIRTLAQVGLANRTAILAKVLCTNAFFLRLPEGEQVHRRG